MENEFPNELRCVQLKQTPSGSWYCNCFRFSTCNERYCSGYKTIAQYHEEQIKSALRILSLPEIEMFRILNKYYDGSALELLKSKGVTEEEIYERNAKNK